MICVLLYVFLSVVEVGQQSDTKVSRNKGVHEIRF